jgi:4-hydroxyphenylpyruvate dioxygenase
MPPETGVRDRVSYVLIQGKMRIMLTTPLNSKHPINTHIQKHGDGVHSLALWVDDAYDAFEQTVSRGAKPYLQPVTLTDELGEVVMSGIHTYGDTVHLFIERTELSTVYLCLALLKWEILHIIL